MNSPRWWLAVKAARRPWSVVETIQVNSICDEVIAPAQDLDPGSLGLLRPLR